MTSFPIADASHGNPQMLAHAILNEDPYPIKALIVNRFEPLQSIAAAATTRKALDKLDLIVAIDVNFSEIAWYADVILPESIYLERADSIQAVSGLKPQLFMRRQAVSPRYDTRPAGSSSSRSPSVWTWANTSPMRPSRISGTSSSRTWG